MKKTETKLFDEERYSSEARIKRVTLMKSEEEARKLNAVGQETRKQTKGQVRSSIVLHCDQQNPHLATQPCRFIK